ncbi:MAG: hypothetical protein QG593_29, partial [Patescibacteria group bacterium]|nr:hypothetical protein [Patescibacteria group bacterium]
PEAQAGTAAQIIVDLFKLGDTNMKFDAVVGNPPYQESVSSGTDNTALSKQLFPHFIMAAILLKPDHLSMITPSRWFTGDAQDKSFLKLRDFIKRNNHISVIHNYKNAGFIFPGVEIKGGVNYFLWDRNYEGQVEFINYYENFKDIQTRDLFIGDIDIIISDSTDISIIKKLNSNNFTSLSKITTGRNAFGIIGKKSILNKISVTNERPGYSKLRCKDNEIRYIKPEAILKNVDIFNKFKVFISKSAGAPHSDTKIIGVPYIGGPKEACTDSLFPIGKFETLIEAENLQKYMRTKFLRYIVAIMKSSQNVTQLVYRFVPLQDFTTSSDIDWSKPIPEIDKQLYKKYELDQGEIDFIESHVKPMS